MVLGECIWLGIDWCDAITATWGSAIASTFIGLILLYQTWQQGRQLNITQEEVKKDLAKDKPFLVVDTGWVQDENKENYIEIDVRNIGILPAYLMTFEVIRWAEEGNMSQSVYAIDLINSYLFNDIESLETIKIPKEKTGWKSAFYIVSRLVYKIPDVNQFSVLEYCLIILDIKDKNGKYKSYSIDPFPKERKNKNINEYNSIDSKPTDILNALGLDRLENGIPEPISRKFYGLLSELNFKG